MSREPPLLPSLFDRLFGDAADVRPVPGGHGITAEAWRRAVLRDVQWLFDTTRRPGVASGGGAGPGGSAGAGAGPASVIDYGLPALAGRPASSCDVDALARLLADTLVAFEPRLRASSLRVMPDRSAPSDPSLPAHAFDPPEGAPPPHVLRFRIEAQLRLRPVPIELLLRTEIDLESGRARVEEAA